MSSPKSKVSQSEKEFILEAVRFFEQPSVMMKSLSWLGSRIESTQKMLPEAVQTKIAQASKTAIEKALEAALKSLKKEDDVKKTLSSALLSAKESRVRHMASVAFTGAVGGAFGFASTLVELPVTTVILLRGIADVAQKMGFDVNDPEVALECLYVFSFGTKSKNDDALNASYYSAKLAFTHTMKQASSSLLKASVGELLAGLKGGAAPALTKVVAHVAERFEINVTEKIVAQGAPVIGAIGGSVINSLFADYYYNCAKFHFGLMKLEKSHSVETVKSFFEQERTRLTTKQNGEQQ